MDCPNTYDPCKGDCCCSPDINIWVDNVVNADAESDAKSASRKTRKGKPKSKPKKKSAPAKRKPAALKTTKPRASVKAATKNGHCPPALLKAAGAGKNRRPARKVKLRSGGKAHASTSSGKKGGTRRGGMFAAMTGR